MTNIRLSMKALEAIKYERKTEGAILNSGLFFNQYPRGHRRPRSTPHGITSSMHLLNVTLKGSDLIRLVLEIEKIELFTELSYERNGISR